MQQETVAVDFSRDPSAIQILERIKELTQKMHALVDDCKATKQELRS